MSNSNIPPATPEDLARLDQLQVIKRGMADKLLRLKADEIQLMAAHKRIDDEWNGLFKRIGEERGLGNHNFDINPQTGEIKVIGQPPQASPQKTPQEDTPAEEAQTSEKAEVPVTEGKEG